MLWRSCAYCGEAGNVQVYAQRHRAVYIPCIAPGLADLSGMGYTRNGLAIASPYVHGYTWYTWYNI